VGEATVNVSTGIQDPWYPLLTNTAQATSSVQLKEG